MIQQRMQEHWREEKGCMQKLHTLTIGAQASLLPLQTGFFSIPSLRLILILKCKYWRKKRTEEKQLFSTLRLFLNKAPSHIAAFRLSRKSWKKKSSLAAWLAFLRLRFKPANQRSGKVIKSAIIFVILVFVVCNDILPFQQNKSKWEKQIKQEICSQKYL